MLLWWIHFAGLGVFYLKLRFLDENPLVSTLALGCLRNVNRICNIIKLQKKLFLLPQETRQRSGKNAPRLSQNFPLEKILDRRIFFLCIRAFWRTQGKIQTRLWWDFLILWITRKSAEKPAGKYTMIFGGTCIRHYRNMLLC